MRKSIGIAWFTAIFVYVNNSEWISSGPYRYIRDPMYAAQIALILSWLPASANWQVGVPGLSGGLLVFSMRIPQEAKARALRP